MAASKLNHDAVAKAVTSLLKWHRSRTASKPPNLLSRQNDAVEDDHDDHVYLVLTLKKTPPPDLRTSHRLPLPHPLHSPQHSEICLLLDDRTKAPNSKSVFVADKIGVSKVLKLSKLKSNYRSFEEKRKLYEAYDLFVAEKRVLGRLPGLLGKQFYRKKGKVPIGVELRGGKDVKGEIERAVGSGWWRMGAGTCSVVKVGRSGMGREKMVENVEKAVEGVVEVLSGVMRGWRSVRSVHLKMSGSVALPVYQAIPDLKVRIEGEKEKRRDVSLVKKRKGRDGEDNYMDGQAKEISDEEEVGSEDEMEVGGFRSTKGKDGENGVGVMGRKIGVSV